jgi:hypothetical protein
MNQDETAAQYTLDQRTEAKVLALAQEQHKEPESVVREAVAKYIDEVVRDVDDEIAYQERVAAIMANLKHPERDNSTFGAWRDSGIDGVAYQKALRGK